MSRFLLVEMYEDLALNDPAHHRFPTTHDGVLLSVHLVNGVKQVTDMEVISPPTLEQWMLPREQSLAKVRKKGNQNRVR